MTDTAKLVEQFLSNGGSISVDEKTVEYRDKKAAKTKDWTKVANITFYKSR